MSHAVTSESGRESRDSMRRVRVTCRHRIDGFRSWPRVEVDLEQPGRTVFVGPNGFGKTNIVEALWYSSTLGLAPGGVRRAADPRGRGSGAVVSTIVVNEGRELAIDLEITAGAPTRRG